jgi:uncharacterized membrane protein
MWTEIRKTFVAGLLTLAPITLTIYIFYLLFRLLDGILRNNVSQFLIKQFGPDFIKSPIPGLGLVALILLIFVTGTIARNYIGKKLFSLGDHIVTQIPLINRIYIAIREISEAVLSEKREVFKKAVLIEYPKKDMYSIAFFTQDTKGPVQMALNKDIVSVLLLTSPNPTSGFLLFVPKKNIIDLDMSVEDAMKLVLSAGSIHLKDGRGITQLFSCKQKENIKKESDQAAPDHEQSSG